MGKQAKVPLSAEVEELRLQLQEWRLVRTRLGPLPAEIWASAVNLAKTFGVGVISKAVGLDYTWLRKRTMDAGPSAAGGPRFIELPSRLMAMKAATVGLGDVKEPCVPATTNFVHIRGRGGADGLTKFQSEAG